MSNQQSFSDFVCVGDTIARRVGGFDITAKIEFDDTARPTDFECYTQEDIAKREKDEWFFCGIVLFVEKGGVLLVDGSVSLWGIEANFGNENNYLTEVVESLVPEAVQEAKVRAVEIQTILGA